MTAALSSAATNTGVVSLDVLPSVIDTTVVPSFLSQEPGACRFYDALFGLAEGLAAAGFIASFFEFSGGEGDTAKAITALFFAVTLIGHYYARHQHRVAQQVVAKIGTENIQLRQITVSVHNSAAQLNTAGTEWQKGTVALSGAQVGLESAASDLSKTDSALHMENQQLKTNLSALQKTVSTQAAQIEQLAIVIRAFKTQLSQANDLLVRFKSNVRELGAQTGFDQKEQKDLGLILDKVDAQTAKDIKDLAQQIGQTELIQKQIAADLASKSHTLELVETGLAGDATQVSQASSALSKESRDFAALQDKYAQLQTAVEKTRLDYAALAQTLEKERAAFATTLAEERTKLQASLAQSQQIGEGLAKASGEFSSATAQLGPLLATAAQITDGLKSQQERDKQRLAEIENL